MACLVRAPACWRRWLQGCSFCSSAPSAHCLVAADDTTDEEDMSPRFNRLQGELEVIQVGGWGRGLTAVTTPAAASAGEESRSGGLLMLSLLML